ncbi:ABC transporter permease [Prauserella muralis]|uniref:ABC transporter permease n=1 Tax=Prauserella muralis TaxID=588067 RepID=A0A2V4B2L4_9PSEU|nr:ABC transporter permease [Prauserella muralis]PXY28267.1 ABC transporter permease [Prauserella muralis]TWE27443.1 ABC-2 family transporter [Prauserella muralis]
MTTVLFVRRFLADYTRNPVNLLVLVLVPVVFVLVASGSLADAAKLFGSGIGPAVETVTAGWTAGFMAGVAMYFQTRAARAADRRLVLAGLRPIRLVVARVATGLLLALLVSAAALLALAVRAGIDPAGRVLTGTLMFAVIYLAIGALVGALARNAVNGTVVILFVWILDVFFGPAMTSPDRVATRVLPTHYVTLWMIDLPSRHGGRLGDLGWALAWTVGAIVIASAVVTLASRIARQPRRLVAAGTRRDQFAVGIRMGLREYRRNRALWALLIVVPVVFIVLAKAITREQFTIMSLVDGRERVDLTFWLPEVHAGTMTPIAIASLATLAGLFVVLDAMAGDRRLELAGFRAGVLLGVRLAVIAAALLLVTTVSLAVTAAVFDAQQWMIYAGGNVLLGAIYALAGVCLGRVFGRVSGVFIAFLIPFLDVGIAQSPMLRPEPAAWAQWLPGYGASRVLLDGGLTRDFDETGSLLIALAWLLALTVAAAVLFRRAPRARAGVR